MRVRRWVTGSAAALALAATSLAASGQELPTWRPLPSPLANGDAQQLFRVFYEASVRSSRAAHHQIAFKTEEDAQPATARWYAEAAIIVSETLAHLADQPRGKTVLAKLTEVTIEAGPQPSATFAGGVLAITVGPPPGPEERVTRTEIEQVLWTR